ncbi:unnamed protein product, partial [Brenthis ino]
MRTLKQRALPAPSPASRINNLNSEATSEASSSAYYPQTNGALERFHAVLRDHLLNKKVTQLVVPLAIMCHNTSLNQSTGFTPHELLFGYKPRLLYTLKDSREFTTNDYLNDLNERLKISRDIA